MTADELIALMAPDTLVAMLSDIEDSAGDGIPIIRKHCFDALVSIVGEKTAAELVPYTITEKLDHGIPYIVREETGNPATFTCRLCRKSESGNFDAMMDAGWIPAYWCGDMEVADEVCPACVKGRLDFSEEYGDYQLRGTNRAEDCHSATK